MQWLQSFTLRIHCKHTNACSGNAQLQRQHKQCLLSTHGPCPNQGFTSRALTRHTNNSSINRNESMLWPDKQIPFNPYSILGQPFQALDQLPVKINPPWIWDLSADLRSTQALCTPGCRCFHAQILWIVLGYSPASDLHIFWTYPCPPSAGVRRCFPQCQTSRKPPFHLAFCTAPQISFPRTGKEVIAASVWGLEVPSLNTTRSSASGEMITAAHPCCRWPQGVGVQ